jgi:hypothetical protein
MERFLISTICSLIGRENSLFRCAGAVKLLISATLSVALDRRGQPKRQESLFFSVSREAPGADRFDFDCDRHHVVDLLRRVPENMRIAPELV